MGLAIGSRLNLIFAGLIPLLLWIKALRSEGFSFNTSIFKNFLYLFSPLALCMLLLGIYNYARFGSATDSGLHYASAVAGINAPKFTFFDRSRIVPDLFFYLLSTYTINGQFPFFHLSPRYLFDLPAGYYGPEPVAGLLVGIPIVNLLLFFPALVKKDKGGSKDFWAVITSLLVLAGTQLVFVSLLTATMRYLVDFSSLFIISSLLLWFYLDDVYQTSWYKRILLRTFTVTTIAYGCVFNLAISFTGYYDGLKLGNPGLYKSIEKVFLILSSQGVL